MDVNVSLVARILQPHVLGNFASVPVTTGRIHSVCATQQCDSSQIWPEGCRCGKYSYSLISAHRLILSLQIAPTCHLIAYIVIAVHPPYPVLVIIFMLAGFGNGLADAAWNAWIGNMANPNEVLGFLHAFYGLGAVLAPLIATTMITKGNRLPWYYFYYVMVHLRSPSTPNPNSTTSNIPRSQWP
jgi:MFS family permease